jgi:phage terminase large subunit-like protein
LQKQKEKLKDVLEELRRLKKKEPVQVPEDPVDFCQKWFNFTPTEYQARLLRDKSKRIVVRWSRQAGKTTTLALRAIWFALRHPKTLTLIVAPSLRQSMILADKLQDFLTGLPSSSRKAIIDKLQRTVIRFKNASRIVALPNSPNLLRGYTAHKLYATRLPSSETTSLCFTTCSCPC